MLGNKKRAKKERMTIAQILNVSFHAITKALRKDHVQPDELRKRAQKKLDKLKEGCLCDDI